MADATLTLTVTETWSDSARLHVLGSIAAVAGDYAAGGLALSLLQSQIKSQKAPVLVHVQGLPLFQYRYVVSTKKVMIYHVNGVEEANGALDAAVVADTTIILYAVFKNLT